jgi:hypothetical protein
MLAETASQTFTLSNLGGGASGELTIALSGPAAFTLLDDGCSGIRLSPSRKKSCAVTVRFAPTTFAQSSATLTATGKRASMAAVTLTGNGASTFLTHSQTTWGTSGSAAATLLANNFFTVYPSGILEVGVSGASGFSIMFSLPTFIISYLPTSGNARPLNADLLDPGRTISGVFGGEVVALQLNVDFADVGLLGAARASGSGTCGSAGSVMPPSTA